MGNALGNQLRDVRKLRGKSLKAIAESAGISAAYLQKLEGGDVQNPSPHVLNGLASALDVPYDTLMELAGYVVHRSNGLLAGTAFDQALGTTDLSEEERKAVAAFVAHLRNQRVTQRSHP